MNKTDKPGNDRFEQLTRENQSLRRAVEELSILNEIATAINSTLSIERIIDLI